MGVGSWKFKLSIALGVAVVWAVRGINAALHGTAVELRDGAQQVAAAATQVSGSSQLMGEADRMVE